MINLLFLPNDHALLWVAAALPVENAGSPPGARGELPDESAPPETGDLARKASPGPRMGAPPGNESAKSSGAVPLGQAYPGRAGLRAVPDLVRAVERGAWSMPASLRARLEEHFELPEHLVLHARAHEGLVVIFPETPLVERRLSGEAGAPAFTHPRLTPGQVRVLRLLGQGLSMRQIAYAMHRTRRWVVYQVREIKRACGAATLEEMVKKGRAAGSMD